MRRIQLLSIVLAIIFTTQSCKQELAVPDGYTLDAEWLSSISQNDIKIPVGVAVNNLNELVILHKAGRTAIPDDLSNIRENTILHVNLNNGKPNLHWGDNLFLMPHGLTVDDKDNVWVTDIGRHQVLKFSRKGMLTLMLGIKHRKGEDETHFNQPTDVAISAKDGSIYVADGYGNNRVVKFDADGTFIKSWGVKGSETGSFNTPHAIEVSNQDEVIVSDRDNNRIQIFDTDGKFIKEKKSSDFEDVYATSFNNMDESMAIVDYKKGISNSTLSNLYLLSKDNSKTKFSIPNSKLHDVVYDKNGNVYVADMEGSRVFKISKKD